MPRLRIDRTRLFEAVPLYFRTVAGVPVGSTESLNLNLIDSDIPAALGTFVAIGVEVPATVPALIMVLATPVAEDYPDDHSEQAYPDTANPPRNRIYGYQSEGTRVLG